MKEFNVCFVFEHWDIRTERVRAKDDKSAKAKIKKLYGRKATSLKCV